MVAPALLRDAEGASIVILTVIGLSVSAVLYAAAVPVTYYAVVYEIADEEGRQSPSDRRFATLLAVVWPLTWLFFLCICLGAAIMNGCAGLNQAIYEARAKRRPWRRRANLIILQKRRASR